MSFWKRDGLDRVTPVPDDERLVKVLAAVAAPASTDELAGEEAAVAAFRAAGLGAAGKSSRGIGPLLAKLFGSKIAVGALVGSVAAGGAFAAVEGLPNVFSGSPTDQPQPVVPFISPSQGPDIEPATKPTDPPDGEPATRSEPATGTPAPRSTEPGDPAADESDSTVRIEVPQLPVSPTDEPEIVPDLPILPTPDLPGLELPGASDGVGGDVLDDALDITER